MLMKGVVRWLKSLEVMPLGYRSAFVGIRLPLKEKQ